MTLAVTTDQILCRFRELVALADTPTLEVSRLAAALNSEGRIALGLLPEGAVWLRALQEGLGDPRKVLGTIKARQKWIEEAVTTLLPPHKPHGLSDIALGALTTAKSIYDPVKDVVLRSRVTDLDSSEIPMIIGGRFVFDGGAAGEVLWDGTLFDRHPPFPLTIPFVFGDDGVVESIVAPEELPDQDLVYQLHFPGGKRRERPASFRVDPSERVIHSQLVLTDPRRIPVHLETVTTYGVDEAGQVGVRAEASPLLGYANVRTWNRRRFYQMFAPHLHSDVPQFFFLPGAVWEVVLGWPRPAEQFQAGRIAQYVRATLQALRGETPVWPEGEEVAVSHPEGTTKTELRISTKETGADPTIATITWGKTLAVGVMAAWEFEQPFPSGKMMRVTAIPVIDPTFPEVHRYLLRRWADSLQWARAELTVRLLGERSPAKTR